jgi:protein transport protein SEC24
MTSLPKLPTKLSSQVRNLLSDFARQRCKPALPVLIARQNLDGTEVELANSLVEDQNNDAMSYVDYLCHVHRIITTEMSGSGGNKSDAGGGNDHSSLWRGW